MQRQTDRQTHTHRGRSHVKTQVDWSDVSVSRGLPEATRDREGSSPGAFSARLTLGPRCLASRNMREATSVVSRCPVCGNLLWQP